MSKHKPSRRRLRSIIAATSGLAIGLAGVGFTALPAAAAAATPPAPAPPAAAAAGSSHTVTLITGDRVHVTDLAGGKHTVEVTTAKPGAGVRTYEVGDELHVIPDAAMPYVTAGTLDGDLFNVSLLIRYGYDDASVDATPIIVEQSGGTTARTFSAPLPGLEVRAELPSIDATAATLGHADSAAAWSALTAPTTRSFSASPELADGIAAIHLDGKVKATLDSSVPYIHAPEAWAQGYTGAGVTVAVLDTGYDDTHPDLQGRVSADSTSFVPGEDVTTDTVGHGTHVASTIAGTGAASGGKNRGVADGATLLVGKVLGSDGSGQDSWIIEGMEWAAQHAPIVSMSLGSYEPSDGTDLMAESLNKISEETGALFVVAAGNSGAPETVGSPGSAADALTVGSVDDPSGALSYFSSQGPLSRSGAMKPDLTGPGNDVTAARSADSPGEGSYVSMSGTSMATPHVAGAAAIVKQQHPEYTAAQLRAALTSTTTDLGYTPYQGGTGVVNVAAAIDSPLIASGSGDFGMLTWGETPAPVERTIEYTNRSDADVTVALDATMADTTPGGGDAGPGPLAVNVPFDALTMDADSLTIPAGETRSVTMTVDPGEGAGGHAAVGHAHRLDQRQGRDPYRTRHDRRVGALRPEGHGHRLRRPADDAVRRAVGLRERVRRAHRRRRRHDPATAEGQVRADVVHGPQSHARHDCRCARRQPRDRARQELFGGARCAQREADHGRRRSRSQGSRGGLPAGRLHRRRIPQQRDHARVDRRDLGAADEAEGHRLHVQHALAADAADADPRLRQEAVRRHPAERLDAPGRHAQSRCRRGRQGQRRRVRHGQGQGQDRGGDALRRGLAPGSGPPMPPPPASSCSSSSTTRTAS